MRANGAENSENEGDHDLSSLDSDASYDVEDSDEEVENSSDKQRRKSFDPTIKIQGRPFQR